MTFDELVSLSDLHLSTKGPFCLFEEADALVWLIGELRQRSAKRRVALCLNGDIVDFLAHENACYLEHAKATERMTELIADPQIAPVWQALGKFVRTPNRFLILILGNHDVELALPDAQVLLRSALTDGDDGANGRLQFVDGGAGFRCRVAGCDVALLHGNEVDAWNWLDYEQLRLTRRAFILSQRPQDWTPNAGTRLVVDGINDFKRDYPWVNLLQPETPMVPALIALVAPRWARKIRRLLDVLEQLAVDKVRMIAGGGMLGEEGLVDAPAQAGLGAAARPWSGVAAASDSDMLEQLVVAWDADYDPENLLGGIAAEEQLGFIKAAIAKLFGGDPAGEMRASIIDWMREHPVGAEAVTVRDEPFAKLDRQVGKEIDCLIAGHTHVAKALRRPGGGAYFNSGTWIPRMQIPEELLRDDEAFRPVWAALSAVGQPLAAFKNVTLGDGMRHSLVDTLRTFVEVTGGGKSGGKKSGDGTKPLARLCCVKPAATHATGSGGGKKAKKASWRIEEMASLPLRSNRGGTAKRG